MNKKKKQEDWEEFVEVHKIPSVITFFFWYVIVSLSILIGYSLATFDFIYISYFLVYFFYFGFV